MIVIEINRLINRGYYQKALILLMANQKNLPRSVFTQKQLEIYLNANNTKGINSLFVESILNIDL